MKFIDIEKVTNIKKNSFEDGKLITKLLILDHGLGAERFKSLTIEQQLYVEKLLYNIIQTLTNHLSTLIKIRK